MSFLDLLVSLYERLIKAIWRRFAKPIPINDQIAMDEFRAFRNRFCDVREVLYLSKLQWGTIDAVVQVDTKLRQLLSGCMQSLSDRDWPKAYAKAARGKEVCNTFLLQRLADREVVSICQDLNGRLDEPLKVVDTITPGN